MARRILGWLLFGATALGAACSNSFPRDIHYGTDAGSNFVPGQFDAAVIDAQVVDARAIDGGIDATPPVDASAD
jgi:hypothetical protein